VEASRYTTVVAPIASAQIDAALRWWSRNRRDSRGALARELEVAIETIEHVPRVGRRVRSRHFKDVRRLLLRATGHHLYYQVNLTRRQIRIVYLRHARRRPVTR